MESGGVYVNCETREGTSWEKRGEEGDGEEGGLGAPSSAELDGSGYRLHLHVSCAKYRGNRFTVYSLFRAIFIKVNELGMQAIGDKHRVNREKRCRLIVSIS